MNAHKQTSFTRPALLFLALAAFPAIGCIGVEADVPDIEVAERGIAFEGAPVAGIEGSVSTSYSQKHTKLDLPDGLDPEVKTLSVTISASAAWTICPSSSTSRSPWRPTTGATPSSWATTTRAPRRPARTSC